LFFFTVTDASRTTITTLPTTAKVSSTFQTPKILKEPTILPIVTNDSNLDLSEHRGSLHSAELLKRTHPDPLKLKQTINSSDPRILHKELYDAEKLNKKQNNTETDFNNTNVSNNEITRPIQMQEDPLTNDLNIDGIEIIKKIVTTESKYQSAPPLSRGGYWVYEEESRKLWYIRRKINSENDATIFKTNTNFNNVVNNNENIDVSVNQKDSNRRSSKEILKSGIWIMDNYGMLVWYRYASPGIYQKGDGITVSIPMSLIESDSHTNMNVSKPAEMVSSDKNMNVTEPADMVSSNTNMNVSEPAEMVSTNTNMNVSEPADMVSSVNSYSTYTTLGQHDWQSQNDSKQLLLNQLENVTNNSIAMKNDFNAITTVSEPTNIVKFRNSSPTNDERIQAISESKNNNKEQLWNKQGIKKNDSENTPYVYLSSGLGGRGGYWQLDAHDGYVWYRYLGSGAFEKDMNATNRYHESQIEVKKEKNTDLNRSGEVYGNKESWRENTKGQLVWHSVKESVSSLKNKIPLNMHTVRPRFSSLINQPVDESLEDDANQNIIWRQTVGIGAAAATIMPTVSTKGLYVSKNMTTEPLKLQKNVSLPSVEQHTVTHTPYSTLKTSTEAVVTNPIPYRTAGQIKFLTNPASHVEGDIQHGFWRYDTQKRLWFQVSAESLSDSTGDRQTEAQSLTNRAFNSDLSKGSIQNHSESNEETILTYNEHRRRIWYQTDDNAENNTHNAFNSNLELKSGVWPHNISGEAFWNSLIEQDGVHRKNVSRIPSTIHSPDSISGELLQANSGQSAGKHMNASKNFERTWLHNDNGRELFVHHKYNSSQGAGSLLMDELLKLDRLHNAVSNATTRDTSQITSDYTHYGSEYWHLQIRPASEISHNALRTRPRKEVYVAESVTMPSTVFVLTVREVKNTSEKTNKRNTTKTKLSNKKEKQILKNPKETNSTKLQKGTTLFTYLNN